MEPFSNKALLLFLSGLFGLAFPLVSLCAEPQRAPQEAVDLIVEIPDTGGATLLPEKAETLGIKPEVARKFYERTIAGSPFREGKLDWDLLMRLIKDKPSSPIALKLLPGVVVEFTPKSYRPIKGSKSSGEQKYRWVGRVTNNAKLVGEGLFIVDEKKKKITATIEFNDKVYEIIPLKNGNLRIHEIDATRYPPERHAPIDSNNSSITPGAPTLHDDPDVPTPTPEPESPPLIESGSEPCVIDVLVVYTQDAEETWLNQGYEDIWLEFDKAIEITNEAFTNSDVRAETRIVYRQLVSRTEFQETGSLESALNKLQDPTHLVGALAQKWRKNTGADLVSLWVSGGDWCGAAPNFTSRNPDRSGKDGFSVVTVGCAAVIKSLAHEIGHNLGARHTRWDEHVPDGARAHNFGHLSVKDTVRTIMALNKECEAEGVYCRRESRYSNPEISYPGIETKSGVRIDEPKAADNHAKLNTTACEVAAYRSARD